MSETHDRRSFFKQLFRGAASTAQDVAGAFREAGGFAEETSDPFGMEIGGAFEQHAVPAPPSQRLATQDDLHELALSHGIGTYVADLVENARPSIRMTRGDLGGRSRLGGVPDLPEGFEWPQWRDEDLDFLGQIDLAEVARLGVETGLPEQGLLLVFLAADARPSGLRPADRGAWRIVLVDGELTPANERMRFPELPLAFSAELTLPSEAAGLPPQLSSFAAFELDAWQRVRESLADRQGVDVEDRSLEWHALHRLGGYPDTTDERMEVDAQLAFNGIDLNTGERYYDPRVPDLERDADQWRLLLQLSTDDELGLQLGYPLGRLYVWIREDDLRQARFDDVWAFVR